MRVHAIDLLLGYTDTTMCKVYVIELQEPEIPAAFAMGMKVIYHWVFPTAQAALSKVAELKDVLNPDTAGDNILHNWKVVVSYDQLMVSGFRTSKRTGITRAGLYIRPDFARWDPN